MDASYIITTLLEYLGLTPTEFSKTIGLKYAQNIYDIQKGKTGISKSIAEKTTSVFPEINIGWLLTGKGEMLISRGISNELSGTPSLPTNIFTGKTDEEVSKLLEDFFVKKLLEMFQNGEILPKEAVEAFIREKDASLEKAYEKIAELKLELAKKDPDFPSHTPTQFSRKR